MIAVVGLSHRSAPLAVRERLALGPEESARFIKSALQLPEVTEAMLISTCNRVELVLAGKSLEPSHLEALSRSGINALGQRAPNAERYLYHFAGRQAVEHLFRVAASLDSLVVGEPQILGQVKSAYELANQARTVGPVLHRVVSRALRAAKRARSQTSIGAGQVSVSSVALDLAEQIFGGLEGRSVALVGSGEMGEAVAKLLHRSGASLTVVGRNAARVRELAERFAAEARGMEDLERTLVAADVVITSTSAPSTLVDQAIALRVRAQRRGRPLFFIDVAVPRDVHPLVGELDDVFLYNVDDLAHVVAESLAGREREAEAALRIVLAEASDYERWLVGEQATPTIRALRAHFLKVLDEELARSLRGKLKHLDASDREALKRMVDASVKKLLHAPASRLRHAARGISEEELAKVEQWSLALVDLFALDGDEDAELPSLVSVDSVANPGDRDADEGAMDESPAARGEWAAGESRG